MKFTIKLNTFDAQKTSPYEKGVTTSTNPTLTVQADWTNNNSKPTQWVEPTHDVISRLGWQLTINANGQWQLPHTLISFDSITHDISDIINISVFEGSKEGIRVSTISTKIVHKLPT